MEVNGHFDCEYFGFDFIENGGLEVEKSTSHTRCRFGLGSTRLEVGDDWIDIIPV